MAGKDYDITTKNLTRLTLREVPNAATIKIDGQTLQAKGNQQPSHARKDRLGVEDRESRRMGRAAQDTRAAGSDRRRVSRSLPAGPPDRHALERRRQQDALRILDHFDHMWAMDYRAHPRIKDDKDVTKEDFAKYNVVLFGDPGSNKWIAKIAAEAAAQVDEGDDRGRRQHASRRRRICRCSPIRIR